MLILILLLLIIIIALIIIIVIITTVIINIFLQSDNSIAFYTTTKHKVKLEENQHNILENLESPLWRFAMFGKLFPMWLAILHQLVDGTSIWFFVSHRRLLDGR